MMNKPLVLPTSQDDILLRQLATSADDEAYFRAVQASRDHLTPFEHETVEKYQTLEAVTAARVNAGDKIRMGIWRGNVFVGTIRAVPDADKLGAEIGYWLDARHTGHGYATLALQTMSDYVIQRFGKAHAWVKPGNAKSIAVLERVGLIYTHNDEKGRLVFEKQTTSSY